MASVEIGRVVREKGLFQEAHCESSNDDATNEEDFRIGHHNAGFLAEPEERKRAANICCSGQK